MITASCPPSATAAASQQVTVGRDSPFRPGRDRIGSKIQIGLVGEFLTFQREQCSPHLFPGIFGQSLEDTVQFEKKFGPRLAPLLVEQCVDFIRERGLDEEGLFRMPGQANLVKELQESFDCGDKPLFDR